MFTRFGFEQIACQQNAMFVADADWKSLCLDLVLAPRQKFLYQILDVSIQDCVAYLCFLQRLVSVIGTCLT